MLKKSDPAVVDRAKKYMLENMDFSGYDIPEILQKSRPWGQLRLIFLDEKSFEIRHDGEKAAFDRWLRGLCSVLNIYPVFCSKAADIVADWRGMTAAEREHLGDDAGDRQFIDICYLAFRLAEMEEKNI